MPDGWTFLFLRNGSTETWRGNAGWVGQTDGTRFTITAPCGWRVKFDTGKIQEIDTPRDRTITIKYNGPAPTEADIDGHAFVQVDPNPATGTAQDIVIAGQKIAISQAPRPRIQHILGKTLITGFDPALSALQWSDGKKETFSFAAPADLTPTLAITKPGQPQRNITWDPSTLQITVDRLWKYTILPGEYITLQRANGKGHTEAYFYNPSIGLTVTTALDGSTTKIYQFVNGGALAGDVRKKEVISLNGKASTYSYTYDENGRLIRELLPDGSVKQFADPASEVREAEPTADQLRGIEQGLILKLAQSKDATARQAVLYDLGLLYSGTLHDISKALATADLIGDRLLKFNIILHAYDYSPTLTNAQKILHYQELLKEYPENGELLHDLIDIRTNHEN
jgi:YD repeat-containing protein